MSFHLFGIRHHGPGCAHSLLRALQELQPDCVLIEGPPEGDDLLSWAQHAEIKPPVALLVFNPDNSQQAVYYPFAEFSPEWQAIRFALQQQIPVQLMDLPVAHSFALEPEAITHHADPLDWLGQAAGYDSGESWWNHLVEERLDGLAVFEAIRIAMDTVRQEFPQRSESRREQLREAHMRKVMRQAQKQGYQRIAVVCGAWHVPALAELPAAKVDNELLKGLDKVKVDATWVPWSFANLSMESGYGAGVESPAWYQHIWQHQHSQTRSIHWLTQAAQLLRSKDIDCSSAHLIEAVRMADTLAALRERPQAGLDELLTALRSTVCMGEEGPIQLIREQLIIGEQLGEIPNDVPLIPLQRDLLQQQKSLRLKPEASQKNLDLDLRQSNDLARSHLLHRLNLLGIHWGECRQGARSAKGSFHEIWLLQWQPELAINLINASRWGNTIVAAACSKVRFDATHSSSLTEISELMNQVLLADLPDVVEDLSVALENLAATTSDIHQLLGAVPPLVQIARYGNVRNTDTSKVEHLLRSLIPRAAISLPNACSSLDDDAAAAMRKQIIHCHQAVRLLDEAELNDNWYQAIRQLAHLGNSHGLIIGLACRLLFDSQTESNDVTATRMNLALSAANPPLTAAAWLEGFLNDSGMILLHDEALWGMVNTWLLELTEEHLIQILPLLRRTFSTFAPGERRQLGERANHGQRQTVVVADTANWQQADELVGTIRQLLGM